MKNIRKITLALLMTFSISFFGMTKSYSNAEAAPAPAENLVYRVYNPNNGEHLHTMSVVEKDYLKKVGWSYEGVSMKMPTTGKPLYRLYNPNSGEHFYTLSSSEKTFLAGNGWKNEGIAWYTPENGTPLYRVYNPNERKAGAHHYTTVLSEKEMLVKAGWKYEGVSWYSLSIKTPIPTVNPTMNQVVEMAKKQIGVPYLWGGTTRSGFDCSGLTQYVYRNARNINIGRVTTDQEKSGTIISLNQAQPGDLVFWGNKGASYHVAIYIGNAQYIHAPVQGENVKIGSFTYYKPSFAVRVK